MTTSPPGAEVAPPSSRRRRTLLALTSLVALAGAGAACWWWIFERGIEHTDNAYVQAPLVWVTPQVAGTVEAVLVDDTQRVAAGQPLVRLDAADARLALARAEAQLAQVRRETRQLYGSDRALQAAVGQRQAELARAQAELLRNQDDAARRRPLAAEGAISAEELRHAESALEAARSGVAAAQAALATAEAQALSQRALTDGSSADRHPAIERALAAVEEARLALQRTELVAPVSGQVVRRTVQQGQRVAAGTTLMTLVPLDQLWVDANFKEQQLRRMRVGQPVQLHADVYGRGVTYHGRVAGLGAGTGAVFSLLPAQNATGNWIKVVQRVPVRIALDPAELAAHPLRVGLSMQVQVKVEGDDTGAPAPAR